MTPKTQKALVSPTPRAPWELRTDWPVPAPGPKELLIKVVAAALNPADWRVQTSGIIPFVTYPFLGGLDGAGIIEEVVKQAQDEAKLAGKILEWKRCVHSNAERRRHKLDGR